MTEYYDGNDYSGMTNEIYEAEQASWNSAYTHAANLIARAAAGETISAKCDTCGKVETVPVGTQFKDVAWGNNQEHKVACNTCATNKAEWMRDTATSGLEQAQIYLFWLTVALLVIFGALYWLNGGL